MVEELREQGHALDGLEVEMIDLMKGEQFEPDFMAVCPNQKIPALVDGDCNLMESCAILEYLAERFPTSLLPSAFTARFMVLQWVYWQAANVGPVFGNKLSYTRYMDDVDPQAKAHPMERFANEAQRLMGVLSRQLEGNDWVCGDVFTIADIAIWPWYGGVVLNRAYEAGEFLDAGSYKHLGRWAEEIDARECVKRGRMVNKSMGPLEEQLHERHDACDFETKTQDKIEAES